MKKHHILLLSVFFVLFSAGDVVAHPTSLSFIENKGQITDQFYNTRKDIDLKVAGEGLNLFIGAGHLHYQFAIPDTSLTTKECDILTYRLDVELIGCNKNAKLIPEEKQPYYEQYYTTGTGNSGVKANTYNRAIYKDIYPGIDWVLYTKDDIIKHEFIVSEGADPALIKIQYSGVSSLTINGEGDLLAATRLGTVTEEAPYCFTREGIKVPSAFHMENNIVSYTLAPYQGELIIDPSMVWGTYYHGGFNFPLTSARDITHHGSHHVYMSGHSGAVDIATVGVHQVILSGSFDAFLVKFDSSGNRIWCTYYGGNNTDDDPKIDCDTLGYIYMAGRTQSNNAIATPGCHQATFGGLYDGFIVKFDSAGSRIWGTYYGGNNYEEIGKIIADDHGYFYISGSSESVNNISTTGAYQTTNAGGYDAFLVKFDTSGQRIWGTYFGGTDSDNGNHVAGDDNGNIFIAGTTFSTADISTVGSHQPVLSGEIDAFLTRFDTSGVLIWATYYGGDSSDYTAGLKTDQSGNVYLYGNTGWNNLGGSSNNIATPGSFMQAPVGGEDAFLVKFNINGQRLWGTYYGGAGQDHPYRNSLEIDNWGNIYISGSTTTTGLSTVGVMQPGYGGGAADGYISKFTSAGTQLWATYYGGTLADGVYASVFDGIGNLYVVGNSSSNNAISTPGAFQENNGNAYFNAFLSRINDCIIPLQPTALNMDTICVNDTLTLSVPMVNGALYYTWSLPGGWTGSSTTDSINVITGTSGGNVSVTAHSACGTSPTFTVNVPVYPAPSPIIAQVGNLLSTGTYVSYQWYLNGSIISGATSQSYTITQQGTYTVSVTDSNGCKAMSSQFPVSVNHLTKDAGIYIYPNPATDRITITSGNKIKSVFIRNVVGQVVLEEDLNKEQAELNIALLTPGIYLISVTDDKGNMQTAKIVKE